MKKSMVLGVLAVLASAQGSWASTLIDYTFGGTDTGPAVAPFNLYTASADTSTGVINGSGGVAGFVSSTPVDVSTLDPAATGFTATITVSSLTSTVSTLSNNGLILGVVSSNPGNKGLYGFNSAGDNAFVYATSPAGTTWGTNNVDQWSGGSMTQTSAGTVPSDVSYQNGFTISLTVLDNNTWKLTSTGLSTNFNKTGTLDTTKFSYADLAGGVGLYAGLQGTGTNNVMTVSHMTLTSVPAPSSLSLALLGLGGLLLVGRRRFRNA